MAEQLTPTEAGRAAVSGNGKCQVCGKDIALRQDGMPMRSHNRTVLHNPDAAPEHRVTSTFECYGSRLPPLEYKEAFEEARRA